MIIIQSSKARIDIVFDVYIDNSIKIAELGVGEKRLAQYMVLLLLVRRYNSEGDQ